MITLQDIQKSFDDIKAVDHVSASIEEGHVFGLVGTNGAGKSTLLRLIAGVLKPDQGQILVDGALVWDAPAVKEKIFYISDNPYFFRSGTPLDMLKFYQTFYPAFDRKKWRELMQTFGLDERRKINTFSKGMQKQFAVICGVSAGVRYLLCDETFDGLDPVMRQAVKTLFVGEIEKRGLTPVIASHNLRELEDICESVGLLHKGGILFERDLNEMKLNIHKVQCVLRREGAAQEIKERLPVLTMEKRGALHTFTVRGQREEIERFMEGLNPVFYELLPLSLEEIFISETEVKGYDVKALIL